MTMLDTVMAFVFEFCMSQSLFVTFRVLCRRNSALNLRQAGPAQVSWLHLALGPDPDIAYICRDECMSHCIFYYNRLCE